MHLVRKSAGRTVGATLAVVVGLLLLPCALIGCSDGGGTDDPDPPIGFPATDHPHVVLKDRFGNQLAASSTEPYSPRATCGTCHDVDEVAKGYHFSQGRSDSDGTFIAKEDYFGDGRDYLLSPGMYGKW